MTGFDESQEVEETTELFSVSRPGKANIFTSMEGNALNQKKKEDLGVKESLANLRILDWAGCLTEKLQREFHSRSTKVAVKK